MLPDADAPRSAHAQRLYSVSSPRVRFRRLLPLPGPPPRLLIAARTPTGIEITLLDLASNSPALPSVMLEAPGFAPSALAYFGSYGGWLTDCQL